MITLKTLPEATAQQVFEQIANHLLTQNKKSVNRLIGKISNGCAYKGANNLKCAAGCLIADDEYNSEFEGCHWWVLVKEKLVPNNHEELITELQKLHDDFEPFQWKEQLIKLARRFDLDSSFIK